MRFCEIHKVTYNEETTDTCPICKNKYLVREESLPVTHRVNGNLESTLKAKKHNDTGIVFSNKKDYMRQYQNLPEQKEYKKLWMRKRRAEMRLKYGKILY